MERNHMNECYSCKHKRNIPGNAHIKCGNPSKPVLAGGFKQGKDGGWFDYPFNFDPTWKGETLCENFNQKPL